MLRTPLVAAAILVAVLAPTAADGGVGVWSRVFAPPDGLGENADITHITYDPTDPHSIWLSSETTGTWHSIDAGAHYTTVPAAGPTQQIAIDPVNPSRMLALASVGAAPVLRSADGGAHWQSAVAGLDPNHHGHVTTGGIAFAGDTAYVTTSDGLFSSADGGATWTLATTALNDRSRDLQGVGSTLYATGSSSGIWSLLRSTDGGATFTRISAGTGPDCPTGFAASPSDPQVIWMACGGKDAANDGVWRTTDDGATWQNVSGPLPVSFGHFTVDPDRIDVAPTDPDTAVEYDQWMGQFVTTDGGAHWQNVSAGIHLFADGGNIAADPSNPTHFLASGDGVYQLNLNADTTPPVITQQATMMSLLTGTAGTTIPVKVSYLAADPNGIASYDLQRLAGGTWAAVGTAGTATSRNVTVPGGAQQFRVRATDPARNTSDWEATPAQPVVVTQQYSTAIHYTGTWIGTSSSTLLGGSARYTTGRGASATFTFTGRSVGLVMTRAGLRGKATVTIDGAAVTLDTRTTTLHTRQILWVRQLSAGTHTIRIANQATPGRPRIDLDAILTIG